MKPLVLSFVSLIFAVGASYADTLRIGTEGARPPYNFLDDAGTVDGFERELGDELCKRLNMTCEWVKNDLDTMIPNLLAKRFDAIMSGMAITDAQSKELAFTQAYVPPPLSVFVASGVKVDLAAGPIAVQSDTSQEAYAEKSGAKVLAYATTAETVDAVQHNSAVAVLLNQDQVSPVLAAANGTLFQVGAPFAIGDGVGIGLRQSDRSLKQKLDAAISAMIADGSLNAMLEKWFDGTVSSF